MMSMKGEGKPVSFVEDCAVPLEHLAEYTSRLTAIFDKHGTRGTWYAHAGSGCLHVRPVLNLRQDKDVTAMRAIAEEAFAMVREYKGSHSGEHGDGLVRSEFNEPMFGSRLARAFEEVKDRFDPKALFNPGKVVRPPKFDDRTLFRYAPGYHGEELETHLDWSAIQAAAADSRARSRCATTTAPAANWPAARCARATASPATSATSPAAAPTRCGSRSAASSGRTRSPPTRWPRR